MLAKLLEDSEDDVICDLMQYYGIKDYTSESLFFIATLVCGLPMDSRIMSRQLGFRVPFSTAVNAMAVDRLSLLWWSKTEDGMKGFNRPDMLIDGLVSEHKEKSDYHLFESGSDFMDEWNRLSGKG